jgi:hypothetical protein
LRRFFDRLVNRHVAVRNPAATVKAARYSVVEGQTPEVGPDQARRLLRSIDVSNPVGLRDRAVLAVLVYTAARVGAVARLAVKSFLAWALGRGLELPRVTPGHVGDYLQGPELTTPTQKLSSASFLLSPFPSMVVVFVASPGAKVSVSVLATESWPPLLPGVAPPPAYG